MTAKARPPGASDTQASDALARNRRASPVAPHLRHYVETFLETFIARGRLDPRLRQLAILRIAWCANQPYAWANHYRNAKAVGVSDADVLATRQPSAACALDEDAAFTLRAVDEMIDRDMLMPETLERAGRVFGDPDIAEEFIHLVGGYRSMVALLNSKRPSLEQAGLPLWPPDGAGPTQAE